MFVEHGHLVMDVMELSSNLPEFTMNQSFRFSLQFVFSSFNDSGLSVHVYRKVYPGSVHSKRLKLTLRSPIGIHNLSMSKLMQVPQLKEITLIFMEENFCGPSIPCKYV